ncbi:unnamed protein product [Thlaspi arvense]|uniref:KIB1-4 beta-propeller domain-containing protein n=1 Tax=Thlaspi arvense TaxID=13288 RepID=A0AAU9RTU3_THLAR|nr:unnamed protein product [Thlaspi arvense]
MVDMDTPKDSMTRENKRGSDWSKLCPGVLRKIMETLSPLDSHRAKLVCLGETWLPPGGSMQKKTRRFTHFGTSCLSRYRYRDSYCMTSYWSWLLMADSYYDLFLFNLLTRKRISLPSISAILDGTVRVERRGWISSAVLWIDEATGSYFVACIFRQRYLFSISNGDESWTNLTLQDSVSGLLDAAYRNSKLYVLTTDQHIKIFDFSRDFSREGNPYRNHPFCFDEKPSEYVCARKIAIEESGEVLVILSLKEVIEHKEKLLFYVFKMNRESLKWERVDSLGDGEMLIFGHGVSVKAPVRDYLGNGDGSKSGSILFVNDDVWSDYQDHNCGVFDIATGRIKWPKTSCFYINNSQWFVPGVAYD